MKITVISTETPSIAHTDSYSEILWRYSIYADPNDHNEGHCIRQTMDGGYIFSGWDGYFPWLDDEEFTGGEAFLEPYPGGNTVDYREGFLLRMIKQKNTSLASRLLLSVYLHLNTMCYSV